MLDNIQLHICKTTGLKTLTIVLYLQLSKKVFICIYSIFSNVVLLNIDSTLYFKAYRENGGIHTMAKWYVLEIVINVTWCYPKSSDWYIRVLYVFYITNYFVVLFIYVLSCPLCCNHNYTHLTKFLYIYIYIYRPCMMYIENL